MTMTPTAARGGETISTLELLEMQIDARLNRAANAAEDAASALSRIADAFETFNALFASVIGTGRTVCHSDREANFGPPVNFVRSGQGKGVFACDADNTEDGED